MNLRSWLSFVYFVRVYSLLDTNLYRADNSWYSPPCSENSLLAESECLTLARYPSEVLHSSQVLKSLVHQVKRCGNSYLPYYESFFFGYDEASNLVNREFTEQGMTISYCRFPCRTRYYSYWYPKSTPQWGVGVLLVHTLCISAFSLTGSQVF